MMKRARVTAIGTFLGLVALGIWDAAFQEGWAVWLDSWSFSLLSMLLIISIFIASGALLFAVIRRLWNGESRDESRDREGGQEEYSPRGGK